MFVLKAGVFGVVCATLLGVGTAQATPVVHHGFGPLPQATFGGNGIPNDAVAVTTIDGGDFILTLGLTATPRFQNPAVTNDGAGTFFAAPGLNFGNPNDPDSGPSATAGATWNFGFFVGIESQSQTFFSLYDQGVILGIELGYDFDPGVGIDEGVIVFDLGNNTDENFTAQSSQNLAFGFLSATGIPGIYPPSGSFDANIDGIYTFDLRAIVFGEFIETIIDVQVGALNTPTDIPEPGALGLLGLGLLGLGFARKRR